MKVRIGLVGYGTGGRYFHAPYIAASPHCELVGVVARSQEKKAEVAEDFPDVRSVDSLADLVELGVDAVVISTPPHTRRELVLEAIEACVAVVADKPFAPNAKAGQELVDTAAKAGVLLNVFHNRRYDTDFVTAMKVRQQLGQLRGLDLRFDLDEPESLELGHEGGLLRDLGSHVVDQALTLLGSAYEVTAHLCFIESEKGRTDKRFRIIIEHGSGAVSTISASKVDWLVSREIRLVGEKGAYVSDYRDVQTEAIKKGQRPAGKRDSWGYESHDRWGELRTADGVETVRSEQGDYTNFYDEFARAVENKTAGPVPAQQGVEVLKVLDAVVKSAAEGRTVRIS
ncbi:Gfo/Idh/MocA family oxidoreductase [Corynebacteriaceae bacterium 6-324]